MKKYDDFDLDLRNVKDIQYTTGRQSDGCSGSCFTCDGSSCKRTLTICCQ